MNNSNAQIGKRSGLHVINVTAPSRDTHAYQVLARFAQFTWPDLREQDRCSPIKHATQASHKPPTLSSWVPDQRQFMQRMHNSYIPPRPARSRPLPKSYNYWPNVLHVKLMNLVANELDHVWLLFARNFDTVSLTSLKTVVHFYFSWHFIFMDVVTLTVYLEFEGRCIAWWIFSNCLW